MQVIETCKYCETDFEAVEWEDGECPKCKATYYWDEVHTLDDFWARIYWDKLDKLCSKGM